MYRYALVVPVLVIWIQACNDKADDTIFQVSTISALAEGQFDGITSYGLLHEYGDFGVGTFDALDGEMIGLDGVFYRVDTAGVAHIVTDMQTSPFADVTFFKADLTDSVSAALDFAGLNAFLTDLLPSQSNYYAIRIDGLFSQLKTRSVARQMEPYPTLVEAIARQTEFTFHDIRGTMVGFYMPQSAEGTTTTGFHFHFISADKTTGGHVLDHVVESVRIEVDDCDRLRVL